MELESYFLKVNEGKIHVRGPKNPNSQLPFAVFLHGASPKSQHTEFWKPILNKIIANCNPILFDRFGHGKSEIREGMKAGIKTQITSMIALVDHLLVEYEVNNVVLIGAKEEGMI
jgi:pimeloyl-ACP methyl ester carboxylesterase